MVNSVKICLLRNISQDVFCKKNGYRWIRGAWRLVSNCALIAFAYYSPLRCTVRSMER